VFDYKHVRAKLEYFIDTFRFYLYMCLHPFEGVPCQRGCEADKQGALVMLVATDHFAKVGRRDYFIDFDQQLFIHLNLFLNISIYNNIQVKTTIVS
jgi:hypothetical protein